MQIVRNQTDQNRTDQKWTGLDQSDIRGAEASKNNKKKNQNSEDPSGSIRDIIANLINVKNTSIAKTCIDFNGKSAGNDPGWIFWGYEFFSLREPAEADR